MTKELRKILDDLDEILVKGDETAVELWHVFTALRGPDDEARTDKKQTTAVIRQKAFPRAAKNRYPYLPYLSILGFVSDGSFVLPTDENHFSQHVRLAAQALGL